MKLFKFLVLLLIVISCKETTHNNTHSSIKDDQVTTVTGTTLVILGTIQDAGSPQIACVKNCCKGLFLNPDNNRKVVSLGVIDSQNQNKYIFDASPDFVSQTRILKNHCGFETPETPDGVFLTHAHIGHYTGLMYLGHEAMNANKVLVAAMPKMQLFLEQNGPWSQLVANKNIIFSTLYDQRYIPVSTTFQVTPFLVPHRDEYSETVGYKIDGPNKSALFIPDIDKWEKWDKDIIEEISKVDYAFLDGTFYDGGEINNRDISEIPHPFIIESMEKFKDLPDSEKSKIYFIHFNHTNPVIDINSEQAQQVIKNGFNIAQINDTFKL